MVYELNSNHHLINELEGHRRRVLALHVNQPDSELVSYGEDETIRICSLDSLQTLEVFKVGRKFHKFEFLSADAFLAC
jgi:WD40 repeat protein